VDQAAAFERQAVPIAAVPIAAASPVEAASTATVPKKQLPKTQQPKTQQPTVQQPSKKPRVQAAAAVQDARADDDVQVGAQRQCIS